MSAYRLQMQKRTINDRYACWIFIKILLRGFRARHRAAVAASASAAVISITFNAICKH